MNVQIGPKIGWCQEELMCKAYDTWNNIALNSKIIQNSKIDLNNSQLKLACDGGDFEFNHEASIGDKRKQQIQQKQMNKASIYSINLNLNEVNFLQDSSNKPWIPGNFKYESGYAGLHEEILLFNNYISPTIEELYMRDEIISKIMKVISKEFPNAFIDVIGSYKTGLFLPTSDIDMVVFGEWKFLPLNCLKQAFIRDQISDYENVKVIGTASVPIIKITESKTELKIDISFNKINGINSAIMIQKCLSEFPSLRPLVMVLKQFLLQWDYNDVWKGGISSYSLILMTISFLQLHPRINPCLANENLGILLIEFFELYGKYFNYAKTAIRVRDGGSYLIKDEIQKQFTSGHTSILCIEDPLDASNDIGKSSHAALKVKQAFEYAYLTLSHTVLPQNKYLLKDNPSILGRILRVTKDILDYRIKIKNLYKGRFTSNIPLVSKQKEDYNNKKVEFYTGDSNNIYLFNNNDFNNNVNKNLLSLFSCNLNSLLFKTP